VSAATVKHHRQLLRVAGELPPSIVFLDLGLASLVGDERYRHLPNTPSFPPGMAVALRLGIPSHTSQP